MVDNKFDFKQIANNSCGISICRKIICEAINLYFSEQKMLVKLNNFFSGDSNLMAHLKAGGSLPTEKIREFLESFGIKSKIEYDIPTSNMSVKFSSQDIGILTILEIENAIYHAVQVVCISNNNVCYYDPGDGNLKQESILSFNEKRRPKAKSGEYLEILYLID
jgi:hypothetical protein